MTPYVRLPSAVYDYFSAGDSIADIAEDLSLTVSECEEMLRIQIQARSLRRDQKKVEVLCKRGTPKDIYLAAVYAWEKSLEFNFDLLDQLKGFSLRDS